MHDLAAQAGRVLRNVRSIEELRASRQRLVAAQDEERRKLERNIHDGAQQQLVALGVQLRLANTMVDRDPEKARELLTRLQGDTQTASMTCATRARHLPTDARRQGLGCGTRGPSTEVSIPVEVVADGVGRLSQDVEAAVYFSRVSRRSRTSPSTPTHLAPRYRSQRWKITRVRRRRRRARVRSDVGRERSGLQGMADRIEAIGGTLAIDSSPGRGTTVTGRVPATSRNTATAPSKGAADVSNCRGDSGESGRREA